jgi:pyruvate/2-oxoglutarate dehydrogenase complex dihydrolipoamide acyltransferase (E2) component/pyruvate/2-oxoglutarate/acetoin dehydrogenase E1 component
MYGTHRPMHFVLRCPVGGNRGYGPTHSQSLQKHFIGIPHLSLYELSPFHDAAPLLERILGAGEPAILFEPKALYAERIRRPGRLDEMLACEHLDGGWAHIWAHIGTSAGTGASVALLAPGGMAAQALDAARALVAEGGVQVHVLVPERLYPLDLRPVTGLLADATVVCVAEEGTEGGTWGTEVAARIHAQHWDRLSRPVVLVSSRGSVIPAAPHLEKKVLAGADAIKAALRSALGRSPATRGKGRPGGPVPLPGKDVPDQRDSVDVQVPKLNSNDRAYVLLSWLAADGQLVRAGSPIAEIETSKAVAELAAAVPGTLHIKAPAGAECMPGETIAWLTGMPGGDYGGAPQPAQGDSGAGEPALASEVRPLAVSRAQMRVADVVSESHREIPAAFVAADACVDALLNALPVLADAAGGTFGLLEVLVMAIASLQPRFPACFSSRADGGAAHLTNGAHVAVTLDAGNGLYLPVIRSAEQRTAADVADQLAGLRMQAVRGTFTEDDLTGANIAISWNNEPGVMLVQPLIPPGLACMISVAGSRRDVIMTGPGEIAERNVVGLGLAHDHRLVNGREATAFLRELAALLDDERALLRIISGRDR